MIREVCLTHPLKKCLEVSIFFFLECIQVLDPCLPQETYDLFFFPSTFLHNLQSVGCKYG